jgi:hypothetical protein
MNVEVNYVAVLAAGIVSMGAGFLWYSNALFGKPWTKLMGYTKESLEKAQKTMGKMYALSFALALLTAYVLSHVMTFAGAYMGTEAVMTGLTSAFWMWVGFVAPVQATDVIFGGKTWKLFWINTGYQLVSLLAMGLTLGFMG